MSPNPPSTGSNLVDTVRFVDTPEGIELELRVAGPVPRGFAWLVDFSIRVMVYILTANLLQFFKGMGMALWLVTAFLLEWLYPVVFEVLWKGQTPGKRALGLRVLKDDGTPVDWASSMQRSLLMFADFLPLLYGTGLGAMLLSRHFQRLGDLVAGTLVVHVEASNRKFRAAPREPHPSGPVPLAEASPVPLTLAEQRALVGFQERRAALHPDRAQELANLLEPLTGLRGPAALLRLAAMAARVRGRA